MLAPMAGDAIAVVAGLCHEAGLEVRRILDVGCGAGVGSCLLAERFPAARVVAVDGSATMLARAQARAERLGLAARVETHLGDLQANVPGSDGVDLVWASMVVHHLGDEAALLGRLRDLVAPGGFVAIVEAAGPVRCLPDEVDLGRPGIWARLDRAWAGWFADMRSDLPGATESAPYPTMLGEVGFEVLVDTEVMLSMAAPLEAGLCQFVVQQVSRTCTQLERHADRDDLGALLSLLEGEGEPGPLLRERGILRARRLLYVGRASPGTPDGASPAVPSP